MGHERAAPLIACVAAIAVFSSSALAADATRSNRKPILTRNLDREEHGFV
jgi:hypothetical protein